MHSDNNITLFDFWDTYLPQYEMVFTLAKAAGAMCSYQAENGYGCHTSRRSAPTALVLCVIVSYSQSICCCALVRVPSCANSWLLNEVLRKRWHREDAYITTDCGAVRNTMGPPLNLKTPEEAAAATINGGTDLEMVMHLIVPTYDRWPKVSLYLCREHPYGTSQWPPRSHKVWSTSPQ